MHNHTQCSHMNNHYAVMGNPINHSLSPWIHQLFAKQIGLHLTYEKIQIDLAHFEQQVNDFFDQGGKGLNITLPCKQRAFAMSDIATSRCLKAQAANTLWRDENGNLKADNTDGIGLLRDLARYIDLTNKKILLLGAGGAARGILAPLLAAHPEKLTLTNRTPEKAQALSLEFPPAISANLSELEGPFDLIINATSAGLTAQGIALSSTLITPNTLCYDLTYQKHASTPFVQWAKANGCIGIDGLGMLVEQAAAAFFIWHGVMPETAPVLKFIH